MILEKNGDRVCFLHIPRTAGRYIATLLDNNGYNYTNDFPGSGNRTIFFHGKELLHLNLKEESELAKVCKIKLPEKRFTVIRNPVEKFISFSKVFESHIKLLNLGWKEMEDPRLFRQMMDEFGFVSGGEGGGMHLTFGLKTINSNAFIDQREYIDDTVKVWRFEDGMGANFIEWLKSTLSLDIKPMEVSYHKKSFDDHMTNPSEKLLDVLYDYYSDECKHFGYTR